MHYYYYLINIQYLPNMTSSASLVQRHDSIMSGLVSMSPADGSRCPLSKTVEFIDCSSTQINDSNVFLYSWSLCNTCIFI